MSNLSFQQATIQQKQSAINTHKIHEIAGKTVIADDSGFEFDYLNVNPSIQKDIQKM